MDRKCRCVGTVKPFAVSSREWLTALFKSLGVIRKKLWDIRSEFFSKYFSILVWELCLGDQGRESCIIMGSDRNISSFAKLYQ